MSENGIFYVAQRVREGRASGYESLEPSVLPGPVHSFADFHNAYNGEGKRDRYTTFADVIDRVILRANRDRSSRGEYGLITQTIKRPTVNGMPDMLSNYHIVDSIPKEGKFEFLANSLTDTLTVSVGDELTALEEARINDPLSSEADSMMAFMDWMDLFSKHLVYMPPNYFILEGASTAITSSIGLIRAVTSVYEESFKQRTNAKDLISIARNSYPLLVNLALKYNTRGLDVALKVLNEVENKDGYTFFDPEKFTIVGECSAMRLAIKDEVQQQIDDALTDKNKQVVGCPALVSLGKGNAVRTLYSWVIDIIEATPETFYP